MSVEQAAALARLITTSSSSARSYMTLVGNHAVTTPEALAGRIWGSDDGAHYTLTVNLASAQQLITFGDGEFTVVAGDNNGVTITLITTADDDSIYFFNPHDESSSEVTSLVLARGSATQFVFTGTNVIRIGLTNGVINTHYTADKVTLTRSF